MYFLRFLLELSNFLFLTLFHYHCNCNQTTTYFSANPLFYSHFDWWYTKALGHYYLYLLTIYHTTVFWLQSHFFVMLKLLEFLNCGGDVIVLVLLSYITWLCSLYSKEKKVFKERDDNWRAASPPLSISLPFPYHTYIKL